LQVPIRTTRLCTYVYTHELDGNVSVGLIVPVGTEVLARFMHEHVMM